MSFRGVMRTSRRQHVRLGPPLVAQIEAFAQIHGLGLSSAIRLLATRGLAAEGDGLASDRQRDASVALAALVASEHAVLMVASVLPEGEHRMHSMAERACQAAEDRIAMFAEQRVEAEQ